MRPMTLLTRPLRLTLLCSALMAGLGAEPAAAETSDLSGHGSTLRLGFRKALAQRLLDLQSGVGNGEFKSYGEAERSAFEQGYRAAMQDVIVMAGAILAGVVFLLTCCSPSLYQKVRGAVRPWVVRRVELERPWVIWVQRCRHPVLDQLHQLAAHTCGVMFYIALLPFLFWVGEAQSPPKPSKT
ncbi:unnamed protein product [Polarella glacialis]|uniref:Uncharacterized protein n=1 Tax=Polarella glacialis TaxID=89957 RepID=A0A813FUC8_POLGL|nr:unnamed protein product [Polarella glacialis]